MSDSIRPANRRDVLLWILNSKDMEFGTRRWATGFDGQTRAFVTCTVKAPITGGFQCTITESPPLHVYDIETHVPTTTASPPPVVDTVAAARGCVEPTFVRHLDERVLMVQKVSGGARDTYQLVFETGVTLKTSSKPPAFGTHVTVAGAIASPGGMTLKTNAASTISWHGDESIVVEELAPELATVTSLSPLQAQPLLGSVWLLPEARTIELQESQFTSRYALGDLVVVFPYGKHILLQNLKFDTRAEEATLVWKAFKAQLHAAIAPSTPVATRSPTPQPPRAVPAPAPILGAPAPRTSHKLPPWSAARLRQPQLRFLNLDS